AVRDLSGHGVLEHVLALALDRRVELESDGVALLEPTAIGGDGRAELVYGAAPERAADHGRRLQCLLLSRSEQVDPGGDDGLDGVRKEEALRELVHRPAPVAVFEQAVVDERPEQLLEEEGIPLG